MRELVVAVGSNWVRKRPDKLSDSVPLFPLYPSDGPILVRDTVSASVNTCLPSGVSMQIALPVTVSPLYRG